MNFFRSIVVFIYLCIYLLIGGVLIALSLDVFTNAQIMEWLNYICTAPNIKLAMAGVGVLFILVGIISAQVSFGKMKREKTFAFENPDGQVVVSLSAIEDLIKRIVKQIPQVKELKSTVVANKRGITVNSRATLFSDSNIPETTEKIQSMIKGKLLEMLGIEETINVKIHIAKLIGRGGNEEAEEETETSRRMPLRGME